MFGECDAHVVVSLIRHSDVGLWMKHGVKELLGFIRLGALSRPFSGQWTFFFTVNPKSLLESLSVFSPDWFHLHHVGTQVLLRSIRQRTSCMTSLIQTLSIFLQFTTQSSQSGSFEFHLMTFFTRFKSFFFPALAWTASSALVLKRRNKFFCDPTPWRKSHTVFHCLEKALRKSPICYHRNCLRLSRFSFSRPEFSKWNGSIRGHLPTVIGERSCCF